MKTPVSHVKLMHAYYFVFFSTVCLKGCSENIVVWPCVHTEQLASVK